MEPRIIGRALGIGVRVAGRIAGQRIAAPASSVPNASQAHPLPENVPQRSAVHNQAAVQDAGRIVAQTAHGVSQGIGGFLRLFRRVGGIVWLEVTGTFFLLFAAIFAVRLWQNWSGIAVVPREFATVAAAVFLYLGVSSFWRARRR